MFPMTGAKLGFPVSLEISHMTVDFLRMVVTTHATIVVGSCIKISIVMSTIFSVGRPCPRRGMSHVERRNGDV
jgi:hypothetical protein